MDDETLGIADIRQMREELRRFDKPPARLQPPFDAEPDKRPIVIPQVFLRQGVTGMFRKPRIVHPANQRVGLQKFCNRKGVLGMLPLSETEGLQTLEELEGVERTQAGANVPEPEVLARMMKAMFPSP